MTKIEEMARAVYEKQCKRDAGNGTQRFAAWDALPLMMRFALKQTMRDALAVLRKPSKAVVDAMVQVDVENATGCLPFSDREKTRLGHVAATRWRQGIDALLAEDPAR